MRVVPGVRADRGTGGALCRGAVLHGLIEYGHELRALGAGGIEGAALDERLDDAAVYPALVPNPEPIGTLIWCSTVISYLAAVLSRSASKLEIFSRK